MIKQILFFLLLIMLTNCQIDETERLGELKTKPDNYELPDEVKKLSNVKTYSIAQDLPYTLEFKKISTFGDSEDVYFNYIGQFVVDESNRVYVADKHDIKVFTPNGEYLTTLGREGRGPGEFSNFAALNLDIKYPLMYAYDDMLNRINVFNLDSMSFSHTIILDPGRWTSHEDLKQSNFRNFFIGKEQQILAGFLTRNLDSNKSENTINYYLINHEGHIISDKIYHHKYTNLHNGTGAPNPVVSQQPEDFPVASTRRTIIDLDSSGFIYSGESEYFFIRVYNPKGKYLRSIYYDFPKSPLNENDIIESYDDLQLQRRAESKDYPDTWPALDHFFIDDENRLWVSTISEDKDFFDWFVLNNNGEVLGEFRWPGERLKRHYQERQIKMVKNGFLYTIEENEKTKMKEVIKYKIIFKNVR